MAYVDKGGRVEFIISTKLNDALKSNLNKTPQEFINYYEILESSICEKFKSIGVNVSYCSRCRTVKLPNEFSDTDKSVCKLCIDKPTKVTVELTRAAMAKTNGKCALCSVDTLTIHHIIPRRYGGKDEIDNLICLCSTCHIKAHNGTYRYDKGYDLEIAEKCKSY